MKTQISSYTCYIKLSCCKNGKNNFPWMEGISWVQQINPENFMSNLCYQWCQIIFKRKISVHNCYCYRHLKCIRRARHTHMTSTDIMVFIRWLLDFYIASWQESLGLLQGINLFVEVYVQKIVCKFTMTLQWIDNILEWWHLRNSHTWLIMQHVHVHWA